MPTVGPVNSANRIWQLLASALWIAWLVYAVSLFWEPFLWHAAQFRNPGPGYFKAFLLAMPAWLMGCGLYLVLRAERPAWRSWEFPALLLIPTALSLGYEPRAALTVLALLAGAYGGGAAGLRLMRIELRGSAERFVLPLLTGWVGLMVVLFPIGVVGLLRPWLTVLLAAAGAVAGWRELAALPALLNQARRVWVEDRALSGGIAGFCFPWLTVLAATGTLTALAPSRIWDVLRNHLYDAMMYALWGALRPVEGISYSFYPQGVELLMAVALPFGGQIAAQLVAASFFPLFIGLVWMVARECGASRQSALLGITLMATVPALHWGSSVAKNDAALAVCVLAGLYSYLRFLDERAIPVLFWGAFLLAAALHVKHPAVFGGFAVSLLFTHAAWKSGQFRRVATRVVLIGILVSSPYFVRAAWYTGNPLYPEAFGSAVGGTYKQYTQSRSFTQRMFGAMHEINFAGQASWEFTSPSANPLGASLLVLGPLVVLALPRRGKWLALLVFTGLYYLSWVSIFTVVRYFIAPLAILMALIAARFVDMWHQGNAFTRMSLAAALVFCLLFGLWGTLLVEVNAPLLAYFAGRISRDQYLTAMTQDYAAILATNRMAGPREKIHGIVNCAGAYVLQPERFSCNPCNRRSCTPTAVLRQVRLGDYDWVILSRSEPLRDSLAPLVRERRALSVYEDQYYVVYRIRR